VLFGSVFGIEGIIAPAWVEPLDAPLAILVVPIAGGAVLLVVGLALAALEALWRGEISRWLATDAALAVMYIAIAAVFVERDAVWVALAAALWFCVGHGIVERSPTAALVALPDLAERLFRLAINTLSFARVGAFALAHAGLASAIAALMHAADGTVARALILVAGNAVVIVLEAMVVSIQTTRLVLFEFFTRFLVAEGRVFRPLPTLPVFAQEN
jgi:V/A-type H+-transporting ATPase subunit I